MIRGWMVFLAMIDMNMLISNRWICGRVLMWWIMLIGTMEGEQNQGSPESHQNFGDAATTQIAPSKYEGR